MEKFEEDLKLGERAQKFAEKILSREFKRITHIPGNFKPYDILADDFKVEVKFDRLSKDTSNVGIEYECNNKPSGISATKSDEWFHIFYYNGELYYSRIPTHKLKAWLRVNWKYLEKTSGGDRNLAKIILIPIEDFITHFEFRPAI